MKKEIILVPKDKCPLDVLAEMGERTRNSWIFLHENAYQHLLESEGASHMAVANMVSISWKATINFPETTVMCEVPSPEGWGKILFIEAEDISFLRPVEDPEDIYFLKMGE